MGIQPLRQRIPQDCHETGSPFQFCPTSNLIGSGLFKLSKARRSQGQCRGLELDVGRVALAFFHLLQTITEALQKFDPVLPKPEKLSRLNPEFQWSPVHLTFFCDLCWPYQFK